MLLGLSNIVELGEQMEIGNLIEYEKKILCWVSAFLELKFGFTWIYAQKDCMLIAY